MSDQTAGSVLRFPMAALETPLIADETALKLVELGLLRFSPGIAPGPKIGTFVPAIQIFADPSLLEAE